MALSKEQAMERLGDYSSPFAVRHKRLGNGGWLFSVLAIDNAAREIVDIGNVFGKAAQITVLDPSSGDGKAAAQSGFWCLRCNPGYDLDQFVSELFEELWHKSLEGGE